MITGPREIVKRARRLRSEMSLPETLLWRELHQRPDGFKFRRQHPAGIYVLDFYCAQARLAIEVDGFAHDSARAAQADAAVMRLVEVCRQRVARLARFRPVPLHQPAAGPPPRSGED